MNITPIEMQIRASDYSEEDHERSPGLHLGQVLAELDQLAHGKRYPETDENTRQTYFTMGFLWERALSELISETAVKRAAGALVRPGEFLSDGIAMSPDAIDLTDYTLEEYKATWLSSNHPIDSEKFWTWINQMKCYCRAIGTKTARLRVFFVMGDYRGSGPQVKCWQFEFTDRELEECWAMVLNHAKSKGWI